MSKPFLVEAAVERQAPIATITVDAAGKARISADNLQSDRQAVIDGLERILAWLQAHRDD